MTMETLFSGWAIINRPIMEVFEYAADPRNLLEWFPAYSKVEVLDEHGGRPTRFRATLAMSPLPWSPTVDVDIVEAQPGRRVSWRIMAVGGAASCEFEPTSKGTVVTITLSLWSTGSLLLGYFASPFRPFVNDLIAQVLLSLKRRAEGRATKPTPLVFFSYRRSQAKYVGGRIYDALCQEFGEGAVFRDMESIPGGSQWLRGIDDALQRCRVVVAHIGDGWETEIRRRLDDGEPDVLRRELETALSRNTTVIPVFTSTEESSVAKRLHEVLEVLPAEGPIRSALSDRQGVMIRSDPDFRRDLEKVIATVWEILREAKVKAAERAGN